MSKLLDDITSDGSGGGKWHCYWMASLVVEGFAGGGGSEELPSDGIGGGRCGGSSSFSYHLSSGVGTSRG